MLNIFLHDTPLALSPIFATYRLLLVLFLMSLLNACGPDATDQALREGDTAFGQMDFTTAIEKYSSVIEQNPTSARAYEGRGAAYFGLNRFDEAIADMDEAIALDADRGWTYFYRGSSYLSLRQFEQAADDLKQAAESGKLPEFDVTRAYRARSIAHMNLENYEAAIEDVTQNIGLQPDLPLNYHDRAQLYEAQSDTSAAIGDYEAFLEMDAESEKADRVRARLATLRGEAVSEASE